MATGGLTDHSIHGAMIPSTMTITIPIPIHTIIPIHTTLRTIHGDTTRIPTIITTEAIMVTDTTDTIPGTPATDIPHITTTADMCRISPAGEDTVQCQEAHTPTLTQGPSQAMHLQVTSIAGGLHPAPHYLPVQVTLPQVQGGQPLRPPPAGMPQLPEQPRVPAEPRMELSAMPVRALKQSQNLNMLDANRVIQWSRTRRVPRLRLL